MCNMCTWIIANIMQILLFIIHNWIINRLIFSVVAPTLPPENVHAILNKPGVIIVTWQPVPVHHRLGVIQGYKVMYTPQTNGNPMQKTVSTYNLSVVLDDLEINTLYSITVAAYTRVGEGPSSQPVVVRTKKDGKGVIKNLIQPLLFNIDI